MKIIRHLVTLRSGSRFWFVSEAKARAFSGRHQGSVYAGAQLVPADLLPSFLSK
jgi:hypothetical protein